MKLNASTNKQTNKTTRRDVLIDPKRLPVTRRFYVVFFFVRLRMRREAACHREHHLLHRHRQEQEQPPGRREPSSCLFHARETFLHDVRIRQQPLRGSGGRESLPGERGVAFVSRVVWRTLVFRESSRLKREPVWSVAGFGLCVS